MRPTPIFFFAFANEEGRFLEALKQESSAIYQILFPLEKAGRLLVAREESVNTDELFLAFRRYRDRMFIFHFAGHAGSDILGLEDQQADASVLAGLFAEQKNALKLVFLNGCATQNQVARLQELGIRAVIATARPVEDTAAQFFAETFYAALASGDYNLREAFLHAKTAIASKHQQPANLFRGIVTPNRQSLSEFPWGLYATRDADLEWKITDPFLPLSELHQASQKRYQDLRQGSFRYLRIEDALLKDEQYRDKQQEIIPIVVVLDEENMLLENGVKKLWSSPAPHAVLTGKGGMGKTVSLVYLWEHYLAISDPAKGAGSAPIPLYLAVEEINEWNESRKNNFIQEQLRNHYYIEDLKDFLGESPGQGPPNVLLLLDGLHHVNPEKLSVLIEEISLLSQTKLYPNLQILLTAQEDVRLKYTKENWPTAFRLLELEPLSIPQIKSYLGDSRPLSTELLDLLRNPMMLSIYKASTQVLEKQQQGSPLKTDITKIGELLFNVEVMAQLSIRERQARNPREMAFQRFILEHLIPYIGWTMYQSGLSLINRKERSVINLHSTLEQALQELLNDAFFDAFDRDFDRYLDERRFHLPPRHLFNQVIREVCVERLVVLVEENEGLRFLHNLFRDYAAARHVLNQIDLHLYQNEIPPILRNALLDEALCRMIGEIEGEHFFNPAGQNIHPAWIQAAGKPNRIARMLDLCRGNFREQELGFAIRNLLRIMILNRGELTGANLQLLDLRKAELNGIRLSRWNKSLIAANFFGARVSRKTFFSETALFRKNFTRFSPDGQRVLFASYAGEVLEWHLETSTCLRAFAAGMRIKNILYTPAGKTLLLYTEDAVHEWNLSYGQVVQTFAPDTIPPEKQGAPSPTPDEKTMRRINRIKNRPGMYLQGCDFQHLHPASQLDEQTHLQLRHFGAVFSEKEAEAHQNMLDAFFDAER